MGGKNIEAIERSNNNYQQESHPQALLRVPVGQEGLPHGPLQRRHLWISRRMDDVTAVVLLLQEDVPLLQGRGWNISKTIRKLFEPESGNERCRASSQLLWRSKRERNGRLTLSFTLSCCERLRLWSSIYRKQNWLWVTNRPQQLTFGNVRIILFYANFMKIKKPEFFGVQTISKEI